MMALVIMLPFSLCCWYVYTFIIKCVVLNCDVFKAMGTTFLALWLREIRRSNYLLPKIREFVTDFGMFISIVVFSLIYNFVFSHIETVRHFKSELYILTLTLCFTCVSFFLHPHCHHTHTNIPLGEVTYPWYLWAHCRSQLVCQCFRSRPQSHIWRHRSIYFPNNSSVSWNEFILQAAPTTPA